MKLLMLDGAVIGLTNESEVPAPYKTHTAHEVKVQRVFMAQKNVISGTEMVTRTVTHRLMERWRYDVSSVIGFGATEEEALANRAIAQDELLNVSRQVVAALSGRYVAYGRVGDGVYKVDRVNGPVAGGEPGEVLGFGPSAGDAVRDAERQLK